VKEEADSNFTGDKSKPFYGLTLVVNLHQTNPSVVTTRQGGVTIRQLA
jgi:hypothetical protein